MTIGQRIQELRKERHITQKRLSEMIGKGFSTVQKYEIDAIQPPNSVIKKIAEAFSISLSEFFSGLNYEEQKKILSDTIIQTEKTIEKASINAATENSIMRYFTKLNISGRRKLIQYAIDLSKIEEYTNWEKDEFLNNGQSFSTNSVKGDTE